MKNTRALLVAGLALLSVILAGCETLRDRVDSGDLRYSLAVSQAVQRFCWASPDPVGRCDRVETVAARVADWVQDTSAEITVARIDQRIRNEIRWDRLNGADAELIDQLLITLRMEADRRFGTGELTIDDAARIGEVFGWVRNAAQRVQ